LHSIEKICGAFGITFAQFFGDGDGSIQITDEQKDLLDKWAALTERQRELFLAVFESIHNS